MSEVVSVVIPCHNYACYLAESIESVFCQSHKVFEVIVVDDESSDNTEEIAKQYPVRYIRINHKGKHTPAHAMNVGVGLTRGDYIVCLAADDKLSPDYIKKCLRVMHRNPSAGFVWTGCQEFGLRDRTRLPRKLVHRYSILREPHGALGAMMVRREVYFPDRYNTAMFYGFINALLLPKSISMYDESLSGYEDWDLAIRACMVGWKGVSIPEPLYQVRVHQSNVTIQVEKTFAIKELQRKYPFMKPYILLSRGFGVFELLLRNPRKFLVRLWNKVVAKRFNVAKIIEPPSRFQHVWVNEKTIVRKVKGKTIVDIGCGVGRWGYLLRGKAHVVGVDIHKPYLLQAKRYENVILASANSLPFGDKAFHTGLAVEVIEHLPKEYGYAFLSEFKRVCYYGILTTPKKFERVDFGVGHPETHVSHWTRNEILEHLN